VVGAFDTKYELAWPAQVIARVHGLQEGPETWPIKLRTTIARNREESFVEAGNEYCKGPR